MKFEEFWSQLTNEISTSNTFYTLKQEKEFDAVYSQGKVMITPQSSKFIRTFSKDEFFKIWNKACKMLKNEQFKRGNFNDITYHGSYILALMKHILKDKEIE